MDRLIVTYRTARY